MSHVHGSAKRNPIRASSPETYYTLAYVFFFLMIRRPPRSTLSLHDALPIYGGDADHVPDALRLSGRSRPARARLRAALRRVRSEEHTSELQSRLHLVCRLLLEKKNKNHTSSAHSLPHALRFTLRYALPLV